MSISPKSESAAIKALRSKGYKATPQRIAICKIALRSKAHPSVQQVFDEVKKIHPTVSLATVYKTLKVLRDLDLVQEINTLKGETRFDPNMKPHINLICLKCGHITDLDDTSVEKITRRVAEVTDFTPTDQRIDINGICRRCNGD